MGGCFGDNPEDRQSIGLLRAQEARAAAHQERATQIFEMKRAALTVVTPLVIGTRTVRRIPNIWWALQEVDGNGMDALAEAVKVGHVKQAGDEIIKIVLAQLMHEANEEAEGSA